MGKLVCPCSTAPDHGSAALTHATPHSTFPRSRALCHRRICGSRDPFSRDPKGSAFADHEQRSAESTVLLHYVPGAPTGPTAGNPIEVSGARMFGDGRLGNADVVSGAAAGTTRDSVRAGWIGCGTAARTGAAVFTESVVVSDGATRAISPGPTGRTDQMFSWRLRILAK